LEARLIRKTHTTQSETLLDISDSDDEDLRCAGLRRAWSPDPFVDLEFPKGRSAALAEAIAKAAPPRRRKRGIAELFKRAEKTGKVVTSVTTPDGITISFGEPKPSDASNPWLDDLKVTKP
jgi:hypothetical protein